MLWDILESLVVGLFEPGPPTTEKAARRRAAFALTLSFAMVIGTVWLIVVGILAHDSDDRSWALFFAASCLLLAGMFWYNARRMVLDQRNDS